MNYPWNLMIIALDQYNTSQWNVNPVSFCSICRMSKMYRTSSLKDVLISYNDAMSK